MKCILLASTALLGFVGAGMAADLPVKAAPYAPPPVYLSPWDGLYIGGNAGSGSDTDSLTISNGRRTFTAAQSANGFLGGVHGGYNKQLGSIVVGLETDANAASLSKTSVNGVTTNLPWFGTTRLRAGFLLTPQILIYGTGGVAYGQAKVTPVPLVQFTIPGVGWTGGGGIEYAFSQNWTIGAEYLHIHLDGPSVQVGTVNVLSTASDNNIGRGKISYKF